MARRPERMEASVPFFLFFEPAQTLVDSLEALQYFLVVRALLMLYLDERRKGDATLKEDGSE